MVRAGLNADVAGPVVSDGIIHCVGLRAAPRPLPRHSHRPRRTLRSGRTCGAGRTSRPGCSSRSLWALWARRTGCTGRPGGAFLRQLAPEARGGIGLMVRTGLNDDVAGYVVREWFIE